MGSNFVYWSVTFGLKHKVVECLVHLGQGVMQVVLIIKCSLEVCHITVDW